MTPHGFFHWNELHTRDAEQAKRFYGEALGWTFDGMEMGEGGTYWICMSGGKPAAGILTMGGSQSDGPAERWVSYLSVDDADARVELAVKAGATIVAPLFDVPGVGRIAMIREPGGAEIGWMTPGEPPEGY